MRYFNTKEKNEVIPGIHAIDSPNVIELDDGNIFWRALPEGKEIEYDKHGTPIGLKSVEEPELELKQQVESELRSAGVTNNSMTSALFRAISKGDPGPLEKIEREIDKVAKKHNITYELLVDYVAGNSTNDGI